MDWFFVPIMIVLVGAGIELVLSASWNRLYFTSGLAVYKHSIQVEDPYPVLPPPAAFEAWFKSALQASLVFKQLGPTEFAFREELLAIKFLGYRAMMHGLLRYDFETKRMTVIGYCNWGFFYGLLAVVIWLLLGLADSGFSLQSLLALIGVSGVIALFSILGTTFMYAFQSERYKEVAEFAAYRWTTPGPGQLPLP